MAVSKSKAKSTTAKVAKAEAKPAPAAPAKTAPAAKPAAKADTPARPAVDPEVRHRMIAEAAYYIAEKRGFIHGHHDADWAEAERQIDRLLGI